MGVRFENINKDLIEWAIVRNGNSLEAFYEKNPQVRSWVDGVKHPTVKQLEEFTHKVHVPFGYMFLPAPPEEHIPLPFFRTNHRGITNKVSLNVFHTIQMIYDRQSWLTEYLNELNFPDLPFVGRAHGRNNCIEIVNDIRNVLGLENDWASELDTWEQALDMLTNKIEESGIFLTFNGIVGSNTKRVIDVDECRGFVLVNKKAPFLFINAADAKTAQMFTIMHELAHVWLGESAGFDNQSLLPANNPIERLSDAIAAEFLVPEKSFLNKWKDIQDYHSLSRLFKVSQLVIARRALDLHLITKEQFSSFYQQQMLAFKLKKSKQGPGGNFYATAKKRVSLRFAGFVNNAVNDNKLLYRDAYRLTNLNGNSYKKFVTDYL